MAGADDPVWFEFVESKIFSKQVRELGGEILARRLQSDLVQNPERGAVVKGTHGVRKARVADAYGRNQGALIVEDDGTISVNNPRVVEAWQRAASWVGAISPPEVVGYRESDAQEVWRAGKAAFMRSWPYLSQDAGSRVRGRFDLTFVPGGSHRHAMVLGENALAVSRYSKHVDEALALERYLSRRDVQLERARATSLPPTVPDLYDDPEVLRANPYYTPLKKVFLGGAVSRPSSVTGRKYAEVSRAYFRAVHSVLTRQEKPSAAAAALERELVWITGFPVATAARDQAAPPAR